MFKKILYPTNFEEFSLPILESLAWHEEGRTGGGGLALCH